jgi:hypothetical protein
VEQGTHDELMAAGGRYTSLLQRQQLEESIEGAAGEESSGPDEEPVATGSPAGGE